MASILSGLTFSIPLLDVLGNKLVSQRLVLLTILLPRAVGVGPWTDALVRSEQPEVGSIRFLPRSLWGRLVNDLAILKTADVGVDLAQLDPDPDLSMPPQPCRFGLRLRQFVLQQVHL